jgi:hypothetical protein
VGNFKERAHYEDLDKDGGIKMALEEMVWTGVIWLRIGSAGRIVNTVLNFRVP